MKIMKTLAIGTATICAVFYSAAGLAHSFAGMAAPISGNLFTGLMHPFTGIDHVLALVLLGGAISLLHSGADRQLKRSLYGAGILAVLLSWSFVHYSGEHFAIYALGFASTSILLMAVGIRLASIGARYKQASSIRIRRKNHSVTQKRPNE